METNKELFKEIFGENEVDHLYRYYEVNKDFDPWFRVSYERVSNNYPGLNEEEKQMYAVLVLYPNHSTFSMYDLKSYFNKLSESRL